MFKKININNLININDGDLNNDFLFNINISLFKEMKILFKIILIRLGEIQIKFGIKIKINRVLTQLISKFMIKVDGSKILNKFIIIFY